MGTADERPLRIMRVCRWTDLTPTMRRVTLAGADVGPLAGSGLHARLLFPEDDQPQWPHVSADGRPVWNRGQARMPIRAYTLRNIRADAGEVDIDFFLHDGDGVAASWAKNLKSDALLGIIGPIGRPVDEADWYLFAGDESSLPPIARMLENLPHDARGLVLIEIADAQERQVLKAPAGMDIRWVQRDGEPGLPHGRLLAQAVVETPVPDTGRVACWLGAELTAFQIARAHWRKLGHIDESRIHVAPYWNAAKQTRTEVKLLARPTPAELFEPVDTEGLAALWRRNLADRTPSGVPDFAAAHAVTEAHLMAALVGESVIRLDTDWEGIVQALPEAGEVTVVTRNPAATHRKHGVFDRIMWNEERPVVLDRNINLRIRLESWTHGFFAGAQIAGYDADGLHIFDSCGRSVLHVLARTPAGSEKLRELAQRFRDSDQSPRIGVHRPSPPPAAPDDAEIDVAALAAQWRSMLDTHDIFALARRHGAQRTQSYRLVPDDLASQVDTELFFEVLKEAARQGEGVMIFVGSPGNVQIHIGQVNTVSVTAERLSVEDETFGLEIARSLAASCWLVSKPTIDGEIRSIELFDDRGDQIAWVFGERRPGSAQAHSWHALLDRICGRTPVAVPA